MNKQKLIEKYEEKHETIFGFPVIQLNQILEDLKQLDEPKKPVVPQFIADWIEVCKEHLTSSLYLAMTPSFLKANNQGIELTIWIKKHEEIFARAWLDGYTVEKEKRYFVKVKGMEEGYNILNYRTSADKWFFSGETEPLDYRTKHTRKELEIGGFCEVFNSPLFEVVEVEE